MSRCPRHDAADLSARYNTSRMNRYDRPGTAAWPNAASQEIGAVRVAEAGASEHELTAMFGGDDASMARVYSARRVCSLDFGQQKQRTLNGRQSDNDLVPRVSC
jgi:hypothetical protein